MLHPHRIRSGFLPIFAVVCLALARLAHGQAAPIFLDGRFADWTGPVEWTDPAGDGTPGGIDLTSIDLANDGENLFLRFDCGTEIGLQATNNLVLYLDTDQNAATGTAISGIGAELKWQFGVRSGTFFRAGGSTTVFQDELRMRQLPSVTSRVFEVAIGRDVRPDGTNLLFTGAGVRVLLRHETAGGDQAPNTGQTLTYLFDPTPVPPPAPIALGRFNAADVRLTAWNVVHLEQSAGGWNAAVTPSADRVLSALDPDILCFEEIYANSAAQTAALVESFLPSGPGEAWYARNNTDAQIVSRFPVLGQWNLDGTAGDHNLAVLLDTSVPLGRQMLLVGAHMFCCTNDAGRQAEADRMMALFRDAKSPGGALTVPAGTILAIAGDLNLVGFARQLTTLRTGDIADEATFGPDFGPDWDGSPLTDVVSSQTEKRLAYTWRSDTSSFGPGRLDFCIYSDSVVALANHFILYTPEMSPAQRTLYGVQANDVTTVSDHLPHTADFRTRTATDTVNPPGAATSQPPWARLQPAGSPGRGTLAARLALDRPARVTVDVFDVRGTAVASLRTGTDPALGTGAHRLYWDGRTNRGVRAPSGIYVLRLLAEDTTGMLLATSTKVTLVR